MRLDRFEIINEEFYSDEVSPAQLDRLLADAWRHFGPQFFRYNFGIYEGDIRRVIPLRIRIDDFELSKSQRRSLRRNADLDTKIIPMDITPEVHELFERHKRRFRSGIPDSIFDFVARGPADSPTNVMEIAVRKDGRLVAASFLDIGENSASSIYGIFEPEERTRSLGIYTMLREIEFARENGKTLYYHGYSYEGESHYDYKKRFRAVEAFDWMGNWRPFVDAE